MSIDHRDAPLSVEGEQHDGGGVQVPLGAIALRAQVRLRVLSYENLVGQLVYAAYLRRQRCNEVLVLLGERPPVIRHETDSHRRRGQATRSGQQERLGSRDDAVAAPRPMRRLRHSRRGESDPPQPPRAGRGRHPRPYPAGLRRVARCVWATAEAAVKGLVIVVEEAERDVSNAKKVAGGDTYRLQQCRAIPDRRELQPEIHQRPQARVGGRRVVLAHVRPLYAALYSSCVPDCTAQQRRANKDVLLRTVRDARPAYA